MIKYLICNIYYKIFINRYLCGLVLNVVIIILNKFRNIHVFVGLKLILNTININCLIPVGTNVKEKEIVNINVLCLAIPALALLVQFKQITYFVIAGTIPCLYLVVRKLMLNL